MTPERVRELLEAVAGGAVTVTRALDQLAWLPAEPVGDGAAPFARLDHHRTLRQGLPEVVFAAGKTPEQTVHICERLYERNGGFLVTRADEPTRARLQERFAGAEVNQLARTVVVPTVEPRPLGADATIAIVSAGTSDLPVAEEAAVTAAAFGATVSRVYDVGVAGLHRIFDASDALRGAGAVIVVAGMEGALPSVVGGLVSQPVIAVPTSVGYGASFGGLAALLGMLNSCAAGVTVVNIDNGFGAACAATRILRTAAARS